MLILFGILNFDQVKNSQRWLEDHDVSFEFHNFKKQGITKQQLMECYNFLPWETLLNKQSRTWKELNEEQRVHLCQTRAISIIQQYPTLIKRPVIQFDQQHFTKLFF